MQTMSCLFHHPFPVLDGGLSGSQVRPYQMLQGFRELGLMVEEVTGHARERKKKMQRLLREIEKGRSFSFLYSESHTFPTLLTEVHHLPTHPDLDFGFFSQLKKHRIPIGLFYRDVYWRFDLYREYPLHKRLITIPMYRYDWWQYTKTVNHLFLPALTMRSYLPSPWPSERLSALPPGGNPRETQSQKMADRPLNLLYVGGVLPPLYDLRPAFEYLRDIHDVTITLCCRKEEWEKVKSLYKIDNLRVNVVHSSGQDLERLYRQADLFFILREFHNYLSFAMPVKVFETMSYGIPLVTLAGSETARFVSEENIGWVVSSKNEFTGLINQLKNSQTVLTMMKENVRQARAKHTWQVRARHVATTLQNL